MRIKKFLSFLFFAIAVSSQPNDALASGFSTKFVIDFRTFSFFPETSLGYLAGFNYSDSPNWGIRAGAYGVNRYGENAFQGNLGGTYWLTEIWTFDLDVEVATHSTIIPYYTLGIGSGVTVSNVATPSISLQFSHFADADSFTIAPAFAWIVVPQLEIMTTINGVFSSFLTGRSTGTVSAAASAIFSPYDYFSFFGSVSVGEEPFDPGDPHMPLASYFSQKVSGGISFTLEGHLGAKINLAHEWRSTDKTVFSGSFSAFYSW